MEWLKLWVPFIGTILGIAANVYINFRQGKKQQEFEEKITQTKIDADLKAKARINWIGEVRHKASELISLLLSLQKNETIFYEQWLRVEEASELLKLYFISNKTEEAVTGIFIKNYKIIVKGEAESVLTNELTNKEKNIYIRKYIEQLIKLYKNDQYKQNLRYTETISRNLDKLFGEELPFKLNYEDVQLQVILEKPEESLSEEEHTYKHIKTSIRFYKEKLEHLEKELKGYQESVDYFSKIIALYLKIEWDKAKQGK